MFSLWIQPSLLWCLLSYPTETSAIWAEKSRTVDVTDDVADGWRHWWMTSLIDDVTDGWRHWWRHTSNPIVLHRQSSRIQASLPIGYLGFAHTVLKLQQLIIQEVEWSSWILGRLTSSVWICLAQIADTSLGGPDEIRLYSQDTFLVALLFFGCTSRLSFRRETELPSVSPYFNVISVHFCPTLLRSQPIFFSSFLFSSRALRSSS